MLKRAGQRSVWPFFLFLAGAAGCGRLSGESRARFLIDDLDHAEGSFEGSRFPSFRSGQGLSGPVIAGGESRPSSLTPPFPSKLRFQLRLPREPFLDFSVALLSPGEVRRARVEFVVTVEAEGKSLAVYRESFRSHQANRWHTRRADLAAWSGEKVALTLEARPALAQGEVPWADRILVAWGNPAVTSKFAERRLRQRLTLARRILCPTAACGPWIPEKPSLVFVLVDALRADYLGAYGFQGDISPNLDRLAMESVVFQNCFAQAPWTKPSLASLFVSLYPEVHAVTNHEGKFWGGPTPELRTGVLPGEAITLAEALREAGYSTAAFVANAWLTPGYGFEQGFEVYQAHRSTEALLEAARAWLGSRAGKPVFLYLHLMDVHGPYDAPESDFEALLDSPTLRRQHLSNPAGDGDPPSHVGTASWFEAQESEAGQADWSEVVRWRQSRSRTVRTRYAAGVRAFDRHISPFLDELRYSGLLDRSFLILTSDHGEELLEHGGWDHGYTLYDHQIHVPLLIRSPEARGSERRVGNVVSLIDLMPTLLSVAGVRAPAGLQGRDLSHLLEGEREEEGEASFSAATKHRPGLHALRTRKHKLIFDSASGASLLFDLVSDPGEYRDVAARDPARAAELRHRLFQHLSESARRGPLVPESAPIPEHLRQRLRALGYLK